MPVENERKQKQTQIAESASDNAGDRAIYPVVRHGERRNGRMQRDQVSAPNLNNADAGSHRPVRQAGRQRRLARFVVGWFLLLCCLRCKNLCSMVLTCHVVHTYRHGSPHLSAAIVLSTAFNFEGNVELLVL